MTFGLFFNPDMARPRRTARASLCQVLSRIFTLSARPLTISPFFGQSRVLGMLTFSQWRSSTLFAAITLHCAPGLCQCDARVDALVTAQDYCAQVCAALGRAGRPRQRRAMCVGISAPLPLHYLTQKFVSAVLGRATKA
jgi:hypothetical protein